MKSAIIVEDEVLASERLKLLLKDCQVTVLDVFDHAKPAIEWLKEHQTDIIFADIGLPEMNGLDFIKQLRQTHVDNMPAVIFTTAYDEYALQAFDLAVIDYIMKPIKLKRLQEAISRIPLRQIQDTIDHNEFSTFIIQTRNQIRQIPWQKVVYLMAEQKTVCLHTCLGEEFLINNTLGHWEETLGDKVFRIHRNTLIMRHAFKRLVRMNPDSDDEGAKWGAELVDCPDILPISRRQLTELKKQFSQENF